MNRSIFIFGLLLVCGFALTLPGQEGDSKVNVEETLKKLSTKAVVQLSEFPMMNDDGSETYDLELLITVVGEPAEKAVKYGNFKIKELVDGEGGKISSKQSFMMDDIENELVAVKRPENKFFSDHPDDGIGIKSILDVEKSWPGKIGKLSGSLDLVVDAKVHDINIKNIIAILQPDEKSDNKDSQESDEQDDSFQDNSIPVSDEQLKKLGIKLSLAESEDGGLEVRLEGNIANILKIEPVNSKGKEHPASAGSYWSGSDTNYLYGFSFEDNAIPKDVELKLSVAEGGSQVTVPFELKDLEVPKQKKE